MASSPGALLGSKKDGCAIASAINNTTASVSANAKVRRLTNLRRLMLNDASKRARDQYFAIDLLALEPTEQLVFAEHEHSIHQLDVLVDFAREHHHGDTGFGQVDEQRIKVALCAEIDATRGVVEQQHAGAGGEQPAMITFCWLPPDSVSMGWLSSSSMIPR